ncbi:MAG: hypothetical protein ACR2PL_21650 [Dehalococcoidia bacterium]
MPLDFASDTFQTQPLHLLPADESSVHVGRHLLSSLPHAFEGIR